MKLYAYKVGSKSAKALAQALNCKIIRHEGKLLNLHHQGIINWGCSAPLEQWRDMTKTGKIYNRPEHIAKAVDKLEAFKAMQGQVSIPEWTDSPAKALSWLVNDKSDVVVRHKLNGHSAQGLEIIKVPEEDNAIPWPVAPLYTRYIKKQHEWRIHVFQGEVFFQQRKARKKEVPDDQVNWQVRNHANGFIYANQDVDAPENVKQEAIKAIMALGLDFGAVDIITTKKGDAYVLEVNTACGLEGTTLDKYAEQFQKLEQ